MTDASGAAIPGATVSLSGPSGSRSTTSGENGGFRFLNVDHGPYRIAVSLTGFTAVNRDVVVNTGQNVDVPFQLGVASVEETVVVTAETPIVDTKRVGTSLTIPKDELSRIPSSRDPWALMRTVPGVLVDRVNVAGSESGQQSNFVGKGADPKDAVWTLDGVVVTDMSAIGSSPDYFTYDAFDEVSFQTGGNDVRMATGGIGVGLVTKRGTNEFHGSVGGYYASDDMQWSNLPDELVGDPRLQGNDKADHTDEITEYSFDLGGPILKDKLWFYGSYGKNDIHIRRLTQSPDVTDAEERHREGQLAGGAERHGVAVLLPGRQDQGRPHRLFGVAAAPRRDALGPDQGVPRQPARLQQGRVEPHLQPQPQLELQGRVLQHGLRPGGAGRLRRGVDLRLRERRGPRHRGHPALRAAAVHAQHRGLVLLDRPRRQPRGAPGRRLAARGDDVRSRSSPGRSTRSA